MSVIRCPRCPKTWTGTTASHCPSCHETFSVDSNGDRHRKGKGADRHCVHPSTVGLVLNKRGRWAMPAGDYDHAQAARPSEHQCDGEIDWCDECEAAQATPEDPKQSRPSEIQNPAQATPDDGTSPAATTTPPEARP